MDTSSSTLEVAIDTLLEKVDQLLRKRQLQPNAATITYNPYWGRKPEFLSLHREQQWLSPQQELTQYPPPQEQWHYNPPSFRYEQPQQERFNTEEVLARYMLENDARLKALDDEVVIVQASLHRIEKRMGELLKEYSEEQENFEELIEIPSRHELENEENNETKGEENHFGVEEEERVEKEKPLMLEQVLHPQDDQGASQVQHLLMKLVPCKLRAMNFGPPQCAPSRRGILVFMGSSYARCSREEHTLFKPP